MFAKVFVFASLLNFVSSGPFPGTCCWKPTSCLWMPSWWRWWWCRWKTWILMRCSASSLISFIWWGQMRTHTHARSHRCVYQARLSCVFSLSLRVTSRVTSPTSTRNLWSANRTHFLHSPLSLRLHYPQPPHPAPPPSALTHHSKLVFCPIRCFIIFLINIFEL